MTKTLYFIIPASPTAAFFSQIAMFDLAIRRRRWRSFEPRVIAVFGDKPNDSTYEIWEPHLAQIIKVFLPNDDSAETDYMRQIDWRFRAVPADADLAIFCDADTLVIGDIEEVAAKVVADQGVAGVIAHYHFPVNTPTTMQQQWNEISEALIGRTMTFSFAYTLAPDEGPDERRIAPFYLNFGAVFVAGAILDRLARRYLDLRPKVMAMTSGSYMAAQIALALAMEMEQVPRRALGMAYNFPNDPLADKRYPAELCDVRILHYLRTDHFDRGRIFADPRAYADFLELKLDGSNRVLQSFVRELTADIYPFAGIS